MASNRSKCAGELHHAVQILAAAVKDGDIFDGRGFYEFVDEAVRNMETEGCSAAKSRARIIAAAQDAIPATAWQRIFAPKDSRTNEDVAFEKALPEVERRMEHHGESVQSALQHVLDTKLDYISAETAREVRRRVLETIKPSWPSW